VRRAQRHLLGLINDVLDFAKLESGRVEYDVDAVPLAEVMADAASMVEAPLVAKGLRFDVRAPAPQPNGVPLLVWADREKLRQVLLNLLSNAGKFTPAGGEVALDVSHPAHAPELVHLTVTDTGAGIPADKLEAIFEPFVQVEAGRTRRAEGTGLGLSISRELLTGFGGALTVTSTPGAGSTFTVVLRRVRTADGRPVDRRANEGRRVEEERRGEEPRRVVEDRRDEGAAGG
jgi:signal transduction histidine kinase